MKGKICENCAFYDEYETEQPYCGCLDERNFERRDFDEERISEIIEQRKSKRYNINNKDSMV
jgi:hypothetical protein